MRKNKVKCRTSSTARYGLLEVRHETCVLTSPKKKHHSGCFLGIIPAVTFEGVLYIRSPRSGELQMQKLKSHLLRTHSLKVLLLKSGVDKCITIYATFTARVSSLLICTISNRSPAFYPKPLAIFFCVRCGQHRSLCMSAE